MSSGLVHDRFDQRLAQFGPPLECALILESLILYNSSFCCIESARDVGPGPEPYRHAPVVHRQGPNLGWIHCDEANYRTTFHHWNYSDLAERR
jgi:hypothetical protein